MPYSEVKAIAKSIAKYCWNKFSYAGFSEWQSRNAERANAKGACSLGGKAKSFKYNELRKKALMLKDDGKTITEISIYLNIHRNTISKWVK